MHKEQERISADSDGNVTIIKSIDAEPVMDGVKMMSDAQIHSPTRDAAGRLYLGSVDMVTAQNWAKECGRPLYSKEWREYAKKKLMSRDYSKFRAAQVRRYT